MASEHTSEEKGVRYVGAREFREHLAEYMASDRPVAVTRHGQTVGYYIPTRPLPSEAEREALRRTAERFHRLVEESGWEIEDIVSEFDTLRKAKRREVARP